MYLKGNLVWGQWNTMMMVMNLMTMGDNNDDNEMRHWKPSMHIIGRGTLENITWEWKN